MVIKRKTYDSSSDNESSEAQQVNVLELSHKGALNGKDQQCVRCDQLCGILLLGSLTGIFIWQFWPNIVSAIL